MSKLCEQTFSHSEILEGFKRDAQIKAINGKPVNVLSDACIAGVVGRVTAEGNARAIKHGLACMPDDVLYLCSEAFKDATSRDNIALRFEDISEMIFHHRNAAERVIDAVIAQADKLAPGTNQFNLKGPKGTAVITQREILLAKYIRTIDARDTAMSGRPIASTAQQCFDNTANVSAQECGDLGKIMAANSLVGRMTTKNDIRVSDTPASTAPGLPPIFSSPAAAEGAPVRPR